jgi:hypothetical protein
MAFVYSFVLEPCFEPYCVDSSATLMIHVVPVVYSQMLHWNRVVGLAFVLNGWIKRASPLGTSTLEPKTLEPKTQSSQAERAVRNRRVEGGGARPSRSY